MNKKHWKH